MKLSDLYTFSLDSSLCTDYLNRIFGPGLCAASASANMGRLVAALFSSMFSFYIVLHLLQFPFIELFGQWSILGWLIIAIFDTAVLQDHILRKDDGLSFPLAFALTVLSYITCYLVFSERSILRSLLRVIFQSLYPLMAVRFTTLPNRLPMYSP